MTGKPARVAYRASLFHCLDEPQSGTDDDAVCFIDDGVLLVEDGHVVAAGPAGELLAGLDDNTEVVDYSGRLIMPGLIDCHVHFPQIDMIAAYGEQLLDWLDRYAYPAEQKFCDSAHAEDAAEFFVSQLLANGTTTALVFATVHPQSVDAIFTAASRYRMRLLSGKVLMDRNCPEALRDGASGGIDESRRLIRQWHGKGRIGYAITPRFAVTSSPGQLALAGDLAAEFPDVHVHTHLAENGDEVDWIGRQFPDRRSYLDVYHHYGLLRQRAVFAHCLHVDDEDRRTLAAAGGTIAFCPTSNLFLGSGLFDLEAARLHGIRTGIGSDVGGGTTLNLLRTLSEAYKVLQLQGQSLPVWRALYLATLGAARALYLDDRIGNFTAGKEADFIVIDTRATTLLARRIGKAQTAAGKLFALMMLADDRAIAATYVMGRRVHPG